MSSIRYRTDIDGLRALGSAISDCFSPQLQMTTWGLLGGGYLLCDLGLFDYLNYLHRDKARSV